MRTKTLIISTIVAFVFVAGTLSSYTTENSVDKELHAALAVNGGVSHFTLPKPGDYASVPQDPNNPITPAKVKLGKLLFHDTGLGTIGKVPYLSETYSCASCHFAGAGFKAGIPQGIGEGGLGFGKNGEARLVDPYLVPSLADLQFVGTPTSMHAAWQPNQLWNGQFGATHLNIGTEHLWVEGSPMAINHLGYEGTEAQAIQGLKIHRMEVKGSLFTDKYGSLFKEAFPTVSIELLFSNEYAGLAIAAYERTVVANQAPWQLYLGGDKTVMTDQEKRGAILFLGKAGCVDCHSGPALNSMAFYALGTNDLEDYPIAGIVHGGQADFDKARLGRGGFTGKQDDMYKFKVPQLYNLSDNPHLFHGASHATIRSVVLYKVAGIPENKRVPESQIATAFVPLGLDNGEVDDLVAFVEKSLRDPNLMRYQPSSVYSGNCIPVSDYESQVDLGCIE